VQALLAIARKDEQRVVDPERQPHRGEHVGGEHREHKRLPDELGAMRSPHECGYFAGKFARQPADQRAENNSEFAGIHESSGTWRRPRGKTLTAVALRLRHLLVPRARSL